jgi:hypothetical protein
MQHHSSTHPITSSTGEPLGLVHARRLLWFTLLLLVSTVTIGLLWDEYWHATRPFHSFYSPPHLFTYSMIGLTALLVVAINFSPKLRPWFGRGFHAIFLNIEIPGPLFILGYGFATLAVAGLLDDIWHSNFGLDETLWSTPHAMIGWGLLVVMLGFVASFLALWPKRPLPWYISLILGYLILSFSVIPFLGPFYQNFTPETVRTIASIPVISAQQGVQHTYRIYLAWNIDRTNPLLIPLGAIWAGAGFALVRRLDQRVKVFLAVVILWLELATLYGQGTARFLDHYHPVSQDPASWLPLPLLPAAIVLVVLLKIGLAERWAWAMAGGTFGFFVFLSWGTHPLAAFLVIFAAPAMVVGASIGKWVYRVLEDPIEWDARWLVPAGVVIPFLLGLLDLYLRMVTT